MHVALGRIVIDFLLLGMGHVLVYSRLPWKLVPGLGGKWACVALGHTILTFLWPGVRCTLGCSRSPQQDYAGGWGAAGVGYSELYSLHSLVAQSEVHTGKFWVAPPGPG